MCGARGRPSPSAARPGRPARISRSRRLALALDRRGDARVLRVDRPAPRPGRARRSPATFSVPERSPRSWRPPSHRGSTRAPARTHSAPTPLGPWILWPETASESAPRARGRHRAGSRRPARRRRADGDGGRRGRAAAARARPPRDGWIVAELVVDEHERDEGRVGPRPRRRASAAARRRPARGHDGELVALGHEALRRARHRRVLEPADDGVPPARRARAAPRTPRALASVPPPVNTISPASAPSAFATSARAASTARAAAAPRPWAEAGFAKKASSTARVAASTSGAGRVEAALSR